MGTRLQGQWQSEKQSTYSVIITDSAYSGESAEFKAVSLKINWRGDDTKERFVGVIGSELQLGIVVDHQDIQDFIDSLVTAEESSLLLSFQYSDIDGLVQNWTGYIVTDLISIEDVPLQIGYVANITATDGIGLLKGIDYAIAGTTSYTGFDTFTTIILRCIGKLSGIVNYMQTIDQNILKVVCNWHEDSYTYSSNINPLSRSRINGNAFYWVDNKGNERFYSCYDVLDQIATAWGARIMFSGKYFWFIQVNEYLTGNNKTVFSYRLDGTESIASGQNLSITHNQTALNTSELLRFSGGFFSYYAPIKKLTVDYQHLQAVNLLAGQVFTHNTSLVSTGVFVSGFGGETRISYTSTLKLESEWIDVNPFENFFFVFRVLIRAGNHRLVGGWTEGEAAWTTDTGKYYYITSPIILEDGDPVPVATIMRLNLVTPPLPANAIGEIAFNIEAYKAYTMSGVEKSISTPAQLPGDIEYTFSVFTNYLEVLQVGTFDGQSDVLRYAAENNAFASKKIEVSTRIGDGPTTVAPGHIEIYDNASAWVLSDSWKVGNTGTGKAFSQLLANEIIRGQLTPVQRYIRGSFQNLAPAEKCLLPHLAIYYASAYWITTGCDFDPQTEITSGDWFRLQSAASGWTEKTVELIEEENLGSRGTTTRGTLRSGGVGAYVGQSISAQPQVQSVRIFGQEFLDTSSGTLTITANGGAMPANEAQITVYQNGQKLLGSQWSKAGAVITIDPNSHYDGSNYEIVFTTIQ
jgi:hypothetical protein